MKAIDLEQLPAGAGQGRVLTSWQRLARHADTPCEGCLALVIAVRRRSLAPAELFGGLCEAGEGLARAWLDAKYDLIGQLRALH